MNREHLECHFLYGNCHWIQGLLSRWKFISSIGGNFFKTLGKRMGRGSEVNDPPVSNTFQTSQCFS